MSKLTDVEAGLAALRALMTLGKHHPQLDAMWLRQLKLLQLQYEAADKLKKVSESARAMFKGELVTDIELIQKLRTVFGDAFGDGRKS